MPPIDPYQVLQVSPAAEQEVVTAAFRALAMKYHPDREPSRYSARRMAELNAAYDLVREPGRRAAFDRGWRKSATAPDPIITPPPRSNGNGAQDGARLDFGRYRGWSLRDLARQDTDYLRWLERHASGKPFRAEIADLLRQAGVASA